MKLTILGSGTSSGVPIIGCSCNICNSKNPKNNRMRSSVYVDLGIEYDESIRYILIDAGPDFRTQALRFKLPRIDAILFTHAHADHIFGLDDVRIYNFKQNASIPIYADQKTSDALKRTFHYCFFHDPNYQGGGIPSLRMNQISPGVDVNLGLCLVTPIRIYHGRMPILGFRIGKFAYLTDCSKIPKESLEYIQNLDLLIISGLRYKAHPTHFTIPEAIEQIELLNPAKAYLTHLSHDIEHSLTDKIIKKKTKSRVELAYDGLVTEINF